MIRFITTLLLLLMSYVYGQQDFQGYAVYESKTSTKQMMQNWSSNNNRQFTPEQMANWEKNMQKAFEKTYILTFDRSASFYSEEEKIEAVDQNQGWGRMMGSWTGGPVYKNIKKKVLLSEREFFGKEFLIKDSLPQYQWQLTAETKQIGNYTCYKATAKRPTNASDFSSMRTRANNEEKKDEEKKSDENKDASKKEVAKTEKEEKPKTSTNFMDGWEMPEEIEITGWYTLDVPINQGPDKYWGLPGLILEINEGNTTILCSKIVLNSKDKKEIKEPKKGKVVTQEEFDKITTEKMNEFREQWRGRSRG